MRTPSWQSGEPAPDAGLLGDVSSDKQRALSAQLADELPAGLYATSGCDAGQCCTARGAAGDALPPRGLLQLANIARRLPAAVANKARSLSPAYCCCCATPAIRRLSRRRAFAGHFRSRRLRLRPSWRKAVPAAELQRWTLGE